MPKTDKSRNVTKSIILKIEGDYAKEALRVAVVASGKQESGEGGVQVGASTISTSS